MDLIPDDAIGILATNNNNPLQRRYTHTAGYDRYLIVSKSEGEIVLSDGGIYDLGDDTYLGGIISPDGAEVYWVNESKPLPN